VANFICGFPYAKASADEGNLLTRRSFSEGGPRLCVPVLLAQAAHRERSPQISGRDID
jgi:hypothetical protein